MNKKHRIVSFAALTLTLLTPLVTHATTYGSTATVAISGGDYTDPVAAMNDLSTWCPAPADNSRCQVKIMPGNYPLSGVLISAPWVDIVGSGAHSTVLEMNGSTTRAAVASNSVYSDLTLRSTGIGSAIVQRTALSALQDSSGGIVRRTNIEMVGNANNSTGFYGSNRSDVLIDHVKLHMNTTGWSTGIRTQNGASVTVRDSEITLEGPSVNIGIEVRLGTGVIQRSAITAKNGTTNRGVSSLASSVTFYESTATARSTSGTSVALRGLNAKYFDIKRSTAIGISDNGTGIAIQTNNSVGNTYVNFSDFHGSSYGMSVDSTKTTKLAGNNISNHVHIIRGTVLCASNVDTGTYTPYATTCP